MRPSNPIKKIVGKAIAAHSRHRARHQPTGCAFAISDRVDYLELGAWDDLVRGHSVFLSRQYLRVLEQAGPENVRQRYALIFQGKQPIAAVVAQAVTASAARVPKPMRHKPVVRTLERIEEN